jgi:hypothetical protein
LIAPRQISSRLEKQALPPKLQHLQPLQAGLRAAWLQQ